MTASPDLLGFVCLCRKEAAGDERLNVLAAAGVKSRPAEQEVGTIAFGPEGSQ